MLFRSLNDFFLAPHSRYTQVRKADILKHPELAILAESDEAGVFLVMSRDGRQIFVQGHPEMCIRDSYNSVYYVIRNSMEESMYYLVETLQIAGAIALAVFLMDSVFKLVGKKKRIKV